MKFTKFNKGSKKIVKGVTIVELLLYMALMSIFMVVLLDVFTATLNLKLSSESTSAINQDAGYILSKLSYDIANADSITLPTTGATSTTLEIVFSGATGSYAINNGNLVKTLGGISMNLNSIDTSLDSITFKNIGNPGGKPTIQISYTVRSKIVLSGANQTQTINMTAGFR